MIDLEQLQILAQLIDNMEIATNKLEEAYNTNNAEKFNAAKKEVLDIQKKIGDMSKV
jgi:hypothetical protein